MIYKEKTETMADYIKRIAKELDNAFLKNDGERQLFLLELVDNYGIEEDVISKLSVKVSF